MFKLYHVIYDHTTKRPAEFYLWFNVVGRTWWTTAYRELEQCIPGPGPWDLIFPVAMHGLVIAEQLKLVSPND